jgi:hypothetical protein
MRGNPLRSCSRPIVQAVIARVRSESFNATGNQTAAEQSYHQASEGGVLAKRCLANPFPVVDEHAL